MLNQSPLEFELIAFRIVIASDINYLEYVKPLIRDLKLFSEFLPQVVLLFDGDLSETVDVQEFALNHKVDLKVIGISELLDNYELNQIRYLTRTTFARLLAPGILSEVATKLLYLDVDILINRDITQIFKVQLNQVLAAVPEYFDSMNIAFKTYDFAYFNAGVLLIDTKKWMETDILSRCIEVNEKLGPFNCQDQDVLNFVFMNNWQVLPPTMNVMVSTNDHSLDLPQLKNPMIVHFVGQFKPWQGIPWTDWHYKWISRNPEFVQSNSSGTVGIKLYIRLFFYKVSKVRFLKIVAKLFRLHRMNWLRRILVGHFPI